MDITVEVVKLVIRALRREAEKHELGEYASDAFMDAADALADALDLLNGLDPR